jgi:hypothetical protein
MSLLDLDPDSINFQTRTLSLQVYDWQSFEMLVDTEIQRVTERNGTIYLLIKPGKSEQKWTRNFIVLDDDRVMRYPDLGYIDSVRVGNYLFHVFEDDLCTSCDLRPKVGSGSRLSHPTKPFVTWLLGGRMVAVANSRVVK